MSRGWWGGLSPVTVEVLCLGRIYYFFPPKKAGTGSENPAGSAPINKPSRGLLHLKSKRTSQQTTEPAAFLGRGPAWAC